MLGNVTAYYKNVTQLILIIYTTN